MDRKVEEYIHRYQLLDKDKRYIVAISGGADSVAMLFILQRLGYQLEAVHCNFHLRGEESDRDETFVKALCREREIPLHLAHFDTAEYARLHHVSTEMAARELRYRYFGQLREDIGAGGICVAHHRDDSVETVLINLIRGTGIQGLTGIRPRNGHILRPMLCVGHQDIVDYLESLRQPYVTDSTNLTDEVVRNKIRLNILPLLREINPAVAENILHTAELMTQAMAILDNAVGEARQRVCDGDMISIPALLKETSPEYLLYELLKEYGFNAPQAKDIHSQLEGQTGKVFSSPTHDLVIDRGRLLIEPHTEALKELRIPETGIYRYGTERKFSFETAQGSTVSKERHTATLDAGKVRFPLTIRGIRQGDRFHPYGMKGQKLVSDYLTDRKRTYFDKRRQLVVADADGQIVWLVNERVSDTHKVTAATEKTLIIQIL